MSLQDRIKQLAASKPAPNEEAMKLRVLVPILSDLGWDVHDEGNTGEVAFEHPVGSGRGSGRKGRVDIALLSTARRQRVVCLIEAKAPGKDLSDHVDQLISYAFYEGASICVLTDGYTWWLFLPREAGPPTDRRFAELELSQAPEEFASDLQDFLGKSSLVSGEAEERAKKVLKALREADHLNSEIPGIWEKMLRGPDQELVELLAKKVYAEVGLRPAPEQIADVLQDMPIRAVVREGQADASKTATSSKQAKDQSKSAKERSKPAKGASRARTPKPTSVTLWGEAREVKSWAMVLEEVATIMHDRHSNDFLEKTEELAGKMRPFVSSSADLFIRAGQIGSTGLYIETNYSAKYVQRRSRQLLELYGYPAEDLKIELQSE